MKEIEIKPGCFVAITDSEYKKAIALEKRVKRDLHKARERYNKSLMMAMSTLMTAAI